MKPQEENILFRVFDNVLYPFMLVLGGFKQPVQETHSWHVKKWKWTSKNGLLINGADKKAKFGHEAPFGLFHMPIFGGLTKYIVIEAGDFNKYWYIGWGNSIQSLKIKQSRIKLLVGKGGYKAYGLSDNGHELKLKVVRLGELGDRKFSEARLF